MRPFSMWPFGMEGPQHPALNLGTGIRTSQELELPISQGDYTLLFIVL